LRQISLDMAAAGVRGKRGDTIRGSMLGNMMRRPVYAGIRVYKGERLGPGEWEPLVSMETFDQAQAILNAPGRFHTRGTAPKYLLSGIAKCGRCEAKLRPRIAESRSEEHTSELQSRFDLVCRLLLEKKNTTH